MNNTLIEKVKTNCNVGSRINEVRRNAYSHNDTYLEDNSEENCSNKSFSPLKRSRPKKLGNIICPYEFGQKLYSITPISLKTNHDSDNYNFDRTCSKFDYKHPELNITTDNQETKVKPLEKSTKLIRMKIKNSDFYEKLSKFIQRDQARIKKLML